MRLIWRDAMALGVSELDDDHRLLFKRIDALAHAVENRLLEAAQIAVQEAEEAMLVHFENEERLFERANDHNVAHHRRSHEHAVSLIAKLRGVLCDDCDLGAATRLMETLIPEAIIRLHQEDANLAQALQASKG